MGSEGLLCALHLLGDRPPVVARPQANAHMEEQTQMRSGLPDPAPVGFLGSQQSLGTADSLNVKLWGGAQANPPPCSGSPHLQKMQALRLLRQVRTVSFRIVLSIPKIQLFS